jgi:hypothetical protein
VDISYLSNTAPASTTLSAFTNLGITNIVILYDSVIDNEIVVLNAQLTAQSTANTTYKSAAIGILMTRTPTTAITTANAKIFAVGNSAIFSPASINLQVSTASGITGNSQNPNSVMAQGLNYIAIVVAIRASNLVVPNITVYYSSAALPLMNTTLPIMFSNAATSVYYPTQMTGTTTI